MMATIPPSAVDLDHLRRTLLELGYHEPVDAPSAPLIHHILQDFHQASQQYNELLEHYDELSVRWKEQQAVTSTMVDGTAIDSKAKFDLRWLEGLDLGTSSIDTSLLIDGEAGPTTINDSLLIRVMEQTRARLETLQGQVDQLKRDNECLTKEKSTIEEELKKAHCASQELSRLLQTKHSQQENLQNELVSLRQQQQRQNHETATILPTLTNLVRSAIAILPTDLQMAYSINVTNEAPLQSLNSLLANVLDRIKREVEQNTGTLASTREERDLLRREIDKAQETITKVKSLVSGYQTQIAELTAQVHQKDLEKGLQGDLAAQLQAMEGINSMLREKVSALERVGRTINVNGGDEVQGMGQNHLKTMIETLATELSTELAFSSHLGQMVEKLNRRRSEQDGELTQLNVRIRELEGKIHEAEGERASLKGRLERLTTELKQKEDQLGNSQEVIRGVQEALRHKESRIDEMNHQAQDLRRSIDQLQSSLRAMRKSEDILKQHATNQDQELGRLRTTLTQVEAERTRAVERTCTLEGELKSLQVSLQDKTAEASKYSTELKYVMAAQEKTVLEQRTARDQVRELEEMVATKRKEKDLLMTTYCKVIKDNERLHGDLKRLQEEFNNSRAVDSQSESALKAYQTKVQAQVAEMEQLRNKIGEKEARATELEQKLDESLRSKRRLEEEVAERNREITSLKGIIKTLEQSKKEIAAQMARFGQQANDLRNHLRRVDAERTELHDKLKSTGGAGGDGTAARELLTQIAGLNVDLDQARSKMRVLEREKDVLEHQLQLERIKSTKLEEILNDSRWKGPITGEATGDGMAHKEELERARKKLQQETEALRKEHDRGVKSVRKHLMNAAHERNRSIKDRSELFTTTHRLGRHGERRRSEEGSTATPSPPDTPPDEYRKVSVRDEVPSSTEKLRNRNQLLKKELAAIRRDFQDALSPERKGWDAELESSLLSLTTTTSGTESGNNGSEAELEEYRLTGHDRTITKREELKRQFEHENRIMEQIIQKVRQDLASVKGNGGRGAVASTLSHDTPPSITT